MKVISVVNLKGGVGKSVVSSNLAVCGHRAGTKTLLVDTDSQGTCRTWASKGAGHDLPPVVALDERNLVRDLPRIADGYKLVIVDSPARLGKEARAAMVVSDLILLPVSPGAADVWALQDTLAVLEEARGLKPDLSCRIVLNMANHTNLGQLVRETIEQFNVQVLDASLGHRVAFGEAMLAGAGVIDHAPGTPAAEEIVALAKEVSALLAAPARSRKTRSQALAAKEVMRG